MAQSYKTQIPRIKVLALVVLGVYKFKKKCNFIKSLNYYFDKDSALKELSYLYDADQQFFRNQSKTLCDFIRKFDLTFDDCEKSFPQIVKKLLQYLKDHLKECKNEASDQTLNFLCMSLKFLSQNSSNELNPLETTSIIELLKMGNMKSFIENTLVSLLVVCYEKQKVEQDSKDNTDLLASILKLPNLSLYSSSIFEGIKNANCETGVKSTKLKVISRVKKSQQVISKSIHTVKSKQETKMSEETEFKFINLSDSSKNRKRNIIFNIVEDLPKNITIQGSDKSMWRTTWQEIVNIHSLVCQGKPLKDDDKNIYLPSILFSKQIILFKWNTLYKTCISLLIDRTWTERIPHSSSLFHVLKQRGTIMYSFFIHRMNTIIFLKASKKQELNNKTIDKLMECIVDFDTLISLLQFEKDFVNMTVDFTYNRYWEIKDLLYPDFLVKFFQVCIDNTTEEYRERGWWFRMTTKVRKKSYDRAIIEKLIVDELNRLRSDALGAIYNCAVRKKKKVPTATLR